MGWKPPLLATEDPEVKKRWLSAELANGRLAMMDGDIEAFKHRRESELKNGRVAMLACMGYIAPSAGPHFPGYLSPSLGLKFADIPNGLAVLSKVPGEGWMQIFLFIGTAWSHWSLYTDSPLRAFESELGVQAPVGCWDPLGLAKDGDVDVLKNGRVAMFAAMGFILPEYFRFPRYLSPSLGITFTDVPNGLAAISKVPALGWAQWFVFCGLVDFGLGRP